MTIAVAFKKPEQLQQVSVEEAYSAAAAAKRAEKATKKRANEQPDPEAEQKPTGELYEPAANIHLYHAEFQQLEELAGIQPGSVKAVITDPPWAGDWLLPKEQSQLDALGQLCKRVLADDGIAIFRYGSHYLHEFFPVMNQYLKYRWMMVELHDNTTMVVPLHGCFLPRHHPILIYSKTVTTLTGRICDVIEDGGKEKNLYMHQWSIGPVRYLVEKFTREGDLICDTCAGSGTVAQACHELHRRFAGCDINPVCKGLWQKRFNSVKERLYDDLYEDTARSLRSSNSARQSRKTELRGEGLALIAGWVGGKYNIARDLEETTNLPRMEGVLGNQMVV